MGDYLLNLFGNTIPGEVTIFIMSLIPFVELRGGILAAKALNIDFLKAFFICLGGTLLPMPFVLVFARQILEWLSGTKLVKLVNLVNNTIEKKIAKIENYKTLGLLIFVAIPLPGTGAWSGALAAAVMKMRFKHAMGSIIIGTIIADLIMSLISYGFLGAIFG